MKKKEKEIVVVLTQKHDWVTAASIANKLGYSVRTIKSYIANINDDYNNIIISSRSGYKLVQNFDHSILDDNQEIDDNNDRKVSLVRLLLNSSEKISIEKVLNDFYISYDTLTKDLASIKSQLALYDLTLKTKNDSIYIEGDKKNKRGMTLDLVYDEISDSVISLDHIQTFFPNIKIDEIHHMLIDALKIYNNYIDDFSLMNIILWLTICINQYINNSQFTPSLSYQKIQFNSAHVSLIVDYISSWISSNYKIGLSKDELNNLAILISTRISKGEHVTITIDERVQKLLDVINTNIRNNFKIDFKPNDNDIRFELHLQNLIARLENKISIRNPQLQNVKKAYPYIYDIAVLCAKIFTKETNLIVPDDEIAFCAIHIAILLEEQMNLESKVKAVIICPKYFSLNSDIDSKIREIFEKTLLIVDVISFTDELSTCQPYDFIISTIVFSTSAKNVIFIKNKLEYDDIIAINKEIEFQKKSKMKHIFKNQLSTLFKEELYFYNPTFKSEEETINVVTKTMCEKGYVGEDFRLKILEREKISSSAIGNIAMPHPIDACAIKSTIAVALFPRGITWGNKTNVNLVLTLAINEENRDLFQEIFRLVIDFISDTNNLQALMNAKTLDQFIKIIASFFADTI